ncbi:MAG: GNAT family N-acetyltransferase [Cytophagales bacterium]|nr:GNAT family N-acetyltransferase [Armatimonadota bacterium]
MFGPVIVGESITLAPLTPEMLPNYIRWFADTDVTRYLGVSHCPTLAMEQAWFEEMAKSDTSIVWAILVEDQHIGSTGIHQINWRNQRAITGNVIGDKTQWGKGYGSEAVRLRTAYAFTNTTLEKLETEAFAENIGSRRCLEKAGYRQYGVARRHVFRAGKWHNMWLADLLRDEWLASTPG